MDEETYENSYMKCPHCGHAHWNMDELELDFGETECESCNKKIAYERRISVSYVARPSI